MKTPKPLETKAQLVLEIDGVKITLDSTGARKLFNELKKFLGEETRVVQYPQAMAIPQKPDRSWEFDRKIIGREVRDSGSPLPLRMDVIC